MITKPCKKLKIQTEQLFYNIKKEIFFTETPFIIVHKKNILKGNILYATKNLSKYTVIQPSGIIELKNNF